jgi:uncharacterized protein
MTEIVHEGRARLSRLTLATVVCGLAVYRAFVSPLLFAIIGPACRFEPTCSQYARRALEQHGLGRGLWLTVQRVLRCRPLGGWGYDPVPSSASDSRHQS